jgi:glucose repression regulatory protein TUP1
MMGYIVISIDLSPAGGLLATGSGDWQARVCEFSFRQSKYLSFSLR